ncbi:Vanillyl-alcohol oxidase C-terminal subdomain 2 [Penicillium expansum]|nr:Vanillyl-alcohol oxidase C-terminal subdomain 2 [Penicillium expansum]
MLRRLSAVKPQQKLQPAARRQGSKASSILLNGSSCRAYSHGTSEPRSESAGWFKLLLAAAGASVTTASLIYTLKQSPLMKRQSPNQNTQRLKIWRKYVCLPQLFYLTSDTGKQAIAEIQQELGEECISTDDEDLKMHGYSEWSSVNIDRLPVAVAFPESTEQVATIARVCHKHKVPMIPYSGGSSVEGHFSAPFGAMDIVVQPSVSWMALNEDIKESGLFFPVDPGPPAKIGGMIATNCSGTNAVRYGTMKDWVVNLTVVLADGRVIKTRQRPRKSSAGYNLNGLFTGSEGTLGFVTEATLKLARIPEETGVALTTFPTMRDAANAATQIVREGIPVGAVELMDDVQMVVINKMGSTGRVWKEMPTLFFKFSGTKAGVQDNVESQAALWSARKEAFWSMLCMRESGHEAWSTDVAVPISRLPDLVEMSKKDLEKLGLFGSMLGHIGDGNFHETILYDGAKEREQVSKCVHDMVHRAIEMEGTCTGEHGIGLGKKEFMVKEVGEGSLAVMRGIKNALDPFWLMNPGKVFDP